MAVLISVGDRIAGKKIAYVAGKVFGPRLITKSGRHGELQGALLDAEA